MFKLFVYGTLKRGFWNDWHLSNSDLLESGYTITGYKLVENGIPFMLPNADTSVKGEIYSIHPNDIQGVFELEYGYIFAPIGMYEGETLYAFIFPEQPAGTIESSKQGDVYAFSQTKTNSSRFG